MRAVLLFVLSLVTLVHTQASDDVCDAISIKCQDVQTLTGLQDCITLTQTQCNTANKPFCAACALVDTSGGSLDLRNPLAAECIYQFARVCRKNVLVGEDAYVCESLSEDVPSPCAQSFANYASIEELVASPEYPRCLSIANSNCLGRTYHPWCSTGGTSLAGRSVVNFLAQLQSACNFPFRAKRGTFVFGAGSVDGSSVNELLLTDLLALTSTAPAQGLFKSANYSVVGTTVTAYVDIVSGVENKSPQRIADALVALFDSPVSNFHRGNATKYVTSLSFSDNFPFSSESDASLTSAQKGGIVAGVLIFAVFVLVVYQLYAYYSKRTGEETDSDDDDEDSQAIHQRNQARYAAANKQEPQQGHIQAQPVQSQDEAITAWS